MSWGWTRRTSDMGSLVVMRTAQVRPSMSARVTNRIGRSAEGEGGILTPRRGGFNARRGRQARSQKRKRPGPEGPGRSGSSGVSLDLHDVGGAGPLGAVDHFEPHPVALIEGPEPLGPDFRVVDEDVRTTLAGEETEALGLVEPLDRSFDHERDGLLSPCLAPLLRAHEPKPPTVGGFFRTPEQRQLEQCER